MNIPAFDGLILGAHLATLDAAHGYGEIADGALGWRDGVLTFVGPRSQLPAEPRALAREVIEASGWITPGLVDCHTHLVFAGDRAREFELRLQGASYEEIARAGGGIVSTVRATRAADEAELLRQSLPRARALLADGATTLEIKSGYGLDFDNERKMLRVARQLGEMLGITVRTTCLAAHALPPEFKDRADDYVTAVCEWLPRLQSEGLVDAVDAFCEGIGFSPEQTRRVFDTARGLGVPVKAARRPAQRPQRRGAGGGIRWPVGRPRRVHVARQRAGDGGPRHRRGAAAGRLPRAARDPAAAAAGVPRARRGDGHRHRLQPRHLAPALVAAGDAAGLHAFQADTGRGAARRDRTCGSAPSGWRIAACCAWACAPTSCSGGWAIRRNCATGLAASWRKPCTLQAARCEVYCCAPPGPGERMNRNTLAVVVSLSLLSNVQASPGAGGGTPPRAGRDHCRYPHRCA
jgi:hypothetical protein